MHRTERGASLTAKESSDDDIPGRAAAAVETQTWLPVSWLAKARRCRHPAMLFMRVLRIQSGLRRATRGWCVRGDEVELVCAVRQAEETSKSWAVSIEIAADGQHGAAVLAGVS